MVSGLLTCDKSGTDNKEKGIGKKIAGESPEKGKPNVLQTGQGMLLPINAVLSKSVTFTDHLVLTLNMKQTKGHPEMVIINEGDNDLKSTSLIAVNPNTALKLTSRMQRNYQNRATSEGSENYR